MPFGKNNSGNSHDYHIRAVFARRSVQFYSIAWSPDGKSIASGSVDNTLRIWDPGSGELRRTLEGHTNSVWSVSWAPDGSKLASGSADETVRIWDSSSGELLLTSEGHPGTVRGLNWSPDASRLASCCSYSKTVKVWDAGSGQLVHTLEGHTNAVRDVRWSPDGSRLASGSVDNTVRIWDGASGELLRTLEGHTNSIRSLGWSPYGTKLASSSYDQTVKLWDVDGGQLLRTLEGHSHYVQSVAWSPDGSKLASGSNDETLRIWHAGSGKLLLLLEGHTDTVRSVSWSPDGANLASGSDDKTIKVWDAGSGHLLRTLQSHTHYVQSASWSPDGSQLASGSDDKSVKVWNAGNGELLHTLEGHTDSVWSVGWSPDGRKQVSGSSDETVRIWDVASGKPPLVLEGHSDAVRSVSWSTDGYRLASGSVDNTVRIWDVASGELLRTLEDHTDSIQSVAWSPDGHKLASCSYDHTVKVWNVDEGRLLRTLEGHTDWVQSVSWSPDESKLASGSDDKTVKVWDVEGGQLLRTLEGHTNSVRGVSWSPDGGLLMSVSEDNTLRVWDVEFGVELHTEQALSAYYPLLASFRRSAQIAGVFGKAKLGDAEIIVRCLDVSSLKTPTLSKVRQSASAKIVLIGESNVGKSCLALRLAKNEYREEGTTHGMRLWKMKAEELCPTIPVPPNEQRDVVIWDMGGQEEYRLVHQLFLPDTNLAMILFEPTRGDAAIDDALEWNLRLENQLSGRKALKLLVGTKLDQPTALIDRSAISTLIAGCECTDFFETSAKVGLGIDELRAAIGKMLDWDKLSKTTSPHLFQETRKIIDEYQQRGEIVLLYDELAERVREAAIEGFDPAAVDTVVSQLAGQGIIAISWLSTGERVLILQIGYINTYACSLIMAARNNRSGVPAIEIADALGLKSYPGIQDNERPDRLKERDLLECVIELLLKRGICLNHQGLLIFPALFPAAQPDDDTQRLETVSLFYDFSGAINNIYSSLVVRLALSERFGRVRLWQNRAEFEQAGEGMCGFRKVERQRGWAHLELLFSEQTPAATRDLFTVFIEEHLRNEGVKIREVLGMVCGKCGNEFAEISVRKRIADGHTDIGCAVCDARWPINMGAQRARETGQPIRDEMIALKTTIARKQRNEAARIKRAARRDRSHLNDAIRILHLSDLHFAADDNPLSKLQALEQDLRDKQGGLGIDALDYLVVSGDLTNTASPKEFDHAYVFLSELIIQFRLSAERCIIVPGNHDQTWDLRVYDWKNRREIDVDKLKPGTFIQQGNGYLILVEDDYPKRFDNFSKFYHQLTQQPYPTNPDAQGLSFLFDQTGLQFLTLNSAWQIDEYFLARSGVNDNAVANALLKADRQISDAIKQKRITEDAHILRLAVWHHPVTGNEKIVDDAYLERLRDAGVVLCLHGHVHEDRADMLGYTHPRRIRVAGAGSFGALSRDRPASMPQLYNVIEIDRDHGKIRVHTRKKSREGGSWGRWSIWPDSKNKRDNSYYDIDLGVPSGRNR